MVKRTIAILVCFCLIFEQAGFAQVAPALGVPAYLSNLAPVADRFRPVQLRSIEFDPASDQVQLLLDKGDLKTLTAAQTRTSSQKLFEYFQTGLVLPNSMFWVNLRPDSPDEMIDPALEKTDLGRILLEADLQLKKDVSRFTNPDTEEGRQYWDKLYAKAEAIYGAQDCEIPTFTRPWIVPGEIIIRESGQGAFIYKATLKVMLEQDYLKDSPFYKFDDPKLKEINEYSSELIRSIIIPKLTREVNSSKRYAELRQVYYSLVLAQWAKAKLKSSGHQVTKSPGESDALFEKIDTKDLSGLTSRQKWTKQTYYKAYQKSFQQGEYNKEETVDSLYGLTVRQYFSGGVVLDGGSTVINIPASATDFFAANLDSFTRITPQIGSRVSASEQQPALSPKKQSFASRVFGLLDTGISFGARNSDYILPPLLLLLEGLAYFGTPLLGIALPPVLLAAMFIGGSFISAQEFYRMKRYAPEHFAITRGNPYVVMRGWQALALGLDGILDMREVGRSPKKFFTNLTRIMIWLPIGLTFVAAELAVDFLNGKRTGQDIVKAKLDVARYALQKSSGIHPAKVLYMHFNRWSFAKDEAERKFMLYETITLHAQGSSDLDAPAEDTERNNTFLAAETAFYHLIKQLKLEEMEENVREMQRRQSTLYKISSIKKEEIRSDDILNRYLSERSRIWRTRMQKGVLVQDRPFVDFLALYGLWDHAEYAHKPYYAFTVLAIVDRYFNTPFYPEQVLGSPAYAPWLQSPHVSTHHIVETLLKAGVIEQRGGEYALREDFKDAFRLFVKRHYREISEQELAAVPEYEGALYLEGKPFRWRGEDKGAQQDGGRIISASEQDIRKNLTAVLGLINSVPKAKHYSEEEFLAALRNPASRMLFNFADGKLVALIWYYDNGDQTIFWDRMATAPSYRRQGRVTALLLYLAENIPSGATIKIPINEANETFNLYERWGFKRDPSGQFRMIRAQELIENRQSLRGFLDPILDEEVYSRKWGSGQTATQQDGGITGTPMGVSWNDMAGAVEEAAERDDLLPSKQEEWELLGALEDAWEMEQGKLTNWHAYFTQRVKEQLRKIRDIRRLERKRLLDLEQFDLKQLLFLWDDFRADSFSWQDRVSPLNRILTSRFARYALLVLFGTTLFSALVAPVSGIVTPVREDTRDAISVNETPVQSEGQVQPDVLAITEKGGTSDISTTVSDEEWNAEMHRQAQLAAEREAQRREKVKENAVLWSSLPDDASVTKAVIDILEKDDPEIAEYLLKNNVTIFCQLSSETVTRALAPTYRTDEAGDKQPSGIVLYTHPSWYSPVDSAAAVVRATESFVKDTTDDSLLLYALKENPAYSNGIEEENSPIDPLVARVLFPGDYSYRSATARFVIASGVEIRLGQTSQPDMRSELIQDQGKEALIINDTIVRSLENKDPYELTSFVEGEVNHYIVEKLGGINAFLEFNRTHRDTSMVLAPQDPKLTYEDYIRNRPVIMERYTDPAVQETALWLQIVQRENMNFIVEQNVPIKEGDIRFHLIPAAGAYSPWFWGPGSVALMPDLKNDYLAEVLSHEFKHAQQSQHQTGNPLRFWIGVHQNFMFGGAAQMEREAYPYGELNELIILNMQNSMSDIDIHNLSPEDVETLVRIRNKVAAEPWSYGRKVLYDEQMEQALAEHYSTQYSLGLVSLAIGDISLAYSLIDNIRHSFRFGILGNLAKFLRKQLQPNLSGSAGDNAGFTSPDENQKQYTEQNDGGRKQPLVVEEGSDGKVSVKLNNDFIALTTRPATLEEFRKAVEGILHDDPVLKGFFLDHRNREEYLDAAALSDFRNAKTHEQHEGYPLTAPEYLASYMRKAMDYAQGRISLQHLAKDEKGVGSSKFFMKVRSGRDNSLYETKDARLIKRSEAESKPESLSDPDTLIIEDKAYRKETVNRRGFEKGRGEVYLVAAWRGRNYLLYRSFTHTEWDAPARQWRAAYQGMMAGDFMRGWIIKEFVENIDDLSPELCRALDDFIRPKEAANDFFSEEVLQDELEKLEVAFVIPDVNDVPGRELAREEARKDGGKGENISDPQRDRSRDSVDELDRLAEKRAVNLNTLVEELLRALATVRSADPDAPFISIIAGLISSGKTGVKEFLTERLKGTGEIVTFLDSERFLIPASQRDATARYPRSKFDVDEHNRVLADLKQGKPVFVRFTDRNTRQHIVLTQQQIQRCRYLSGERTAYGQRRLGLITDEKIIDTVKRYMAKPQSHLWFDENNGEVFEEIIPEKEIFLVISDIALIESYSEKRFDYSCFVWMSRHERKLNFVDAWFRGEQYAGIFENKEEVVAYFDSLAQDDEILLQAVGSADAVVRPVQTVTVMQETVQLRQDGGQVQDLNVLIKDVLTRNTTLYPLAAAGRQLYLMSDHGVAAAAWEKARLDGLIPDNGILVHIDWHDDFGSEAAPYARPATAEDIRRINFNSDDFIAPACCAGLIREIYWVKPKAVLARGDYVYYAAVLNFSDGSRKVYFNSTMPELGKADFKDVVSVTGLREIKVHEISPEDIPDLRAQGPVIVDIDADFLANRFAAIKGPGNVAEAVGEITDTIHKNINPGIITLALSPVITTERYIQPIAREFITRLLGTEQPDLDELITIEDPFVEKARQDLEELRRQIAGRDVSGGERDGGKKEQGKARVRYGEAVMAVRTLKNRVLAEHRKKFPGQKFTREEFFAALRKCIQDNYISPDPGTIEDTSAEKARKRTNLEIFRKNLLNGEGFTAVKQDTLIRSFKLLSYPSAAQQQLLGYIFSHDYSGYNFLTRESIEKALGSKPGDAISVLDYLGLIEVLDGKPLWITGAKRRFFKALYQEEIENWGQEITADKDGGILQAINDRIAEITAIPEISDTPIDIRQAGFALEQVRYYGDRAVLDSAEKSADPRGMIAKFFPEKSFYIQNNRKFHGKTACSGNCYFCYAKGKAMEHYRQEMHKLKEEAASLDPEGIPAPVADPRDATAIVRQAITLGFTEIHVNGEDTLDDLESFWAIVDGSKDQPVKLAFFSKGVYLLRNHDASLEFFRELKARLGNVPAVSMSLSWDTELVSRAKNYPEFGKDEEAVYKAMAQILHNAREVFPIDQVNDPRGRKFLITVEGHDFGTNSLGLKRQRYTRFHDRIQKALQSDYNRAQDEMIYAYPEVPLSLEWPTPGAVAEAIRRERLLPPFETVKELFLKFTQQEGACSYLPFYDMSLSQMATCIRRQEYPRRIVDPQTLTAVLLQPFFNPRSRHLFLGSEDQRGDAFDKQLGFAMILTPGLKEQPQVSWEQVESEIFSREELMTKIEMLYLIEDILLQGRKAGRLFQVNELPEDLAGALVNKELLSALLEYYAEYSQETPPAELSSLVDLYKRDRDKAVERLNVRLKTRLAEARSNGTIRVTPAQKAPDHFSKSVSSPEPDIRLQAGEPDYTGRLQAYLSSSDPVVREKGLTLVGTVVADMRDLNEVYDVLAVSLDPEAVTEKEAAELIILLREWIDSCREKYDVARAWQLLFSYAINGPAATRLFALMTLLDLDDSELFIHTTPRRFLTVTQFQQLFERRQEFVAGLDMAHRLQLYRKFREFGLVTQQELAELISAMTLPEDIPRGLREIERWQTDSALFVPLLSDALGQEGTVSWTISLLEKSPAGKRVILEAVKNGRISVDSAFSYLLAIKMLIADEETRLLALILLNNLPVDFFEDEETFLGVLAYYGYKFKETVLPFHHAPQVQIMVDTLRKGEAMYLTKLQIYEEYRFRIARYSAGELQKKDTIDPQSLQKMRDLELQWREGKIGLTELSRTEVAVPVKALYAEGKARGGVRAERDGGSIERLIREQNNKFYINAREIMPEYLPPNYSTAAGLRQPRAELRNSPQSVAEIPQPDIRLLLKDGKPVVPVSVSDMGSAQVMFGTTGRDNAPVVLKGYGRDEIKLLRDYKGALIADDLGIGPKVHGLFKDDEGALWLAMDVVPGDFPDSAGNFITAQTVTDRIEIQRRLAQNGIFPVDDFQYFVSPSGHVWLIDQISISETLPEEENASNEDLLLDLAMLIWFSNNSFEELLESARKNVGRVFPALSEEFERVAQDQLENLYTPRTAYPFRGRSQSFQVQAQQDGGTGQQALSGIDFRALPVGGLPQQIPATMPQVMLEMQKLAKASKIEDLDKEWQDIEAQMRTSPMPYNRIKEYIAVCATRTDARQHMDKTVCCILNILKIEEEQALETSQELKDLLVYIG